MNGPIIRPGPYTAPPLAPGAVRAGGRDELAELRAEIAGQLREIGELRAELAEIGRRLAGLERAARVASGDRGDRATELADLVRRLADLERAPD